jgi:hypothetical protein
LFSFCSAFHPSSPLFLLGSQFPNLNAFLFSLLNPKSHQVMPNLSSQWLSPVSFFSISWPPAPLPGQVGLAVLHMACGALPYFLAPLKNVHVTQVSFCPKPQSLFHFSASSR